MDISADITCVPVYSGSFYIAHNNMTSTVVETLTRNTHVHQAQTLIQQQATHTAYPVAHQSLLSEPTSKEPQSGIAHGLVCKAG